MICYDAWVKKLYTVCACKLNPINKPYKHEIIHFHQTEYIDFITYSFFKEPPYHDDLIGCMCKKVLHHPYNKLNPMNKPYKSKIIQLLKTENILFHNKLILIKEPRIQKLNNYITDLFLFQLT